MIENGSSVTALRCLLCFPLLRLFSLDFSSSSLIKFTFNHNDNNAQIHVDDVTLLCYFSFINSDMCSDMFSSRVLITMPSLFSSIDADQLHVHHEITFRRQRGIKSLSNHQRCPYIVLHRVTMGQSAFGYNLTDHCKGALFQQVKWRSKMPSHSTGLIWYKTVILLYCRTCSENTCLAQIQF